jgi:hypothetical protein
MLAQYVRKAEGMKERWKVERKKLDKNEWGKVEKKERSLKGGREEGEKDRKKATMKDESRKI